MQSRANDRERSRVANLSSFSLQRSPFIRASLLLLAAGAATLVLTGCGPRRVRADFKGYENSYAVTSNHEELLNLARLNQHDPTYFFKLAQISSTYQMQAGLTGSGSLATVSSPPATTVPIGGGTPTATYQNYSAFNFVPVSDEANAQIALTPVNAEFFYSLYLQDWRLDQLFRLTVDRIEITLPLPPDPNHPGSGPACRVEVIRNMPPPSFDAKYNYDNDGFSLASYITFLRISAVIYALQKHGLLLLRGQNVFEPVDQNSYIPNPAGPSGGTAQKPGGSTMAVAGGNPPPGANSPGNSSAVVLVETPPASSGDAAPKNPSAPAAKDFNDAWAKNDVWELVGADEKGNGGRWELGSFQVEPQFQLTDHQEATQSGYAPECAMNTGPGTQQPCNPQYGQNVAGIEQTLIADFKNKDNGMTALLGADGGEGFDLTQILEIIYNGFSVEESPTEQQSQKNLCTPGSGSKPARISAHLVMRSLISVMAAAATEQDAFDALTQKDPSLLQLSPSDQLEFAGNVEDFYSAVHLATTGQLPDPKTELPRKMAQFQSEVAKGPHFTNLVPEIEQLPVLKLNWTDAELAQAQNSEEELEQRGLALRYGDPKRRDKVEHRYLITDMESPPVMENLYWNRDMFRLINELSSQVSVDSSKFPLPAILQLPIQ